jgi:ferredoxin-NADP reductase
VAEVKTGTVIEWRTLSPILALFRLAPAEGTRFPEYRPGQYIALRREARLTRRVTGPDGLIGYEAVKDAAGVHQRGPVTHSYSIASAPYETERDGWLEFYVVLERDERGEFGRLTESLFQIRLKVSDNLGYVDRIVGDFTLERRAAGARNVAFVGTGTGLAPFASMLKQMHFEGNGRGARYTLFHTNRTREELAYDEELREIAAAGRVDLVYVPTVSRPSLRDIEDPTLGVGRANNVLRHLFGMPLKEDADLAAAEAQGGDVAAARRALERAVTPALPREISAERLRERLRPAETVILTCGNPSVMADVETVARAQGIRLEKEDW